MQDHAQELAKLKREIERLNKIVRELTEAVAYLAAKDERAQNFIEEIRQLGESDGSEGDGR